MVTMLRKAPQRSIGIPTRQFVIHANQGTLLLAQGHRQGDVGKLLGIRHETFVVGDTSLILFGLDSQPFLALCLLFQRPNTLPPVVAADRPCTRIQDNLSSRDGQSWQGNGCLLGSYRSVELSPPRVLPLSYPTVEHARNSLTR